jgi:hypothetical protein
MAKTIGYLDGTDPLWLSDLLLRGYDTLPISNGADGHGINILHLNPQHHLDLVIGYVHKIVPFHEQELSVQELLHATRVYSIPMLIACPPGMLGVARTRLGELPPNVELVEVGQLLERAAKLLK